MTTRRIILLFPFLCKKSGTAIDDKLPTGLAYFKILYHGKLKGFIIQPFIFYAKFIFRSIFPLKRGPLARSPPKEKLPFPAQLIFY